MKAERPEQGITDEQRVAIFLAMCLTNPALGSAPGSFVYHNDIEQRCRLFWEAAGVFRNAGTWRRAAQRAMGVQIPSGTGQVLKRGLLGITAGARVSGKVYYRFTFNGTFAELLRAAGTDYTIIAHGNRAR